MKFIGTYQDIISPENLLEAWREFLCGKKQKEDVQEFEINLMGNILDLHQDLKQKTLQIETSLKNERVIFNPKKT